MYENLLNGLNFCTTVIYISHPKKALFPLISLDFEQNNAIFNRLKIQIRNFYQNIHLFYYFSSILSSCGGFQKVDTRKVPISGPERAKKNVEEGRGVSLGGKIGGNRSTNYEFSTSNPMWRATLVS